MPVYTAIARIDFSLLNCVSSTLNRRINPITDKLSFNTDGSDLREFLSSEAMH